MCDPNGSSVAEDETVNSFKKLAISPPEPAPSIRESNLTNLFQLPAELMAEVFTAICHADSDKFLGDKSRNKKTTPLTLGSVCGQWRDIVWSTPHIWSHVSLCVDDKRCTTQVALLSEWIARSGVCPLTINLVFVAEELWTERIPSELIELLAANAYRWRSINFVLPEAWYPFLEPTKNSYHLLTTVSTQPLWSDCGLSPSQRKRLELFANAPKLHDLHLNGYYLTDVAMPWNQLTRFTLQHVYLDECFDALPKTPNLTWCRIYTILINDVERRIVPCPVELLVLEKLIIYSAAWKDTVLLLTNMSFPSLRSFEISAPQDDVDISCLPALLLGANGRHITRLALTEYKNDLEEKDALDFLRDMPLLEQVEIDLVQTSRPILPHFFVDLLKAYPLLAPEAAATESYILPRLQRFSFVGPIQSYLPEPANLGELNFDKRLLAVLRHRRTTPQVDEESTRTLLRFFEVKTECAFEDPPYVDLDVMEGLRQLVNEGLSLSVVVCGKSWL